MGTELEIIVNKSGLEESKAKRILERFGNYFNITAEWQEKVKSLTVTDEAQTGVMKVARAGRLYLRKLRLDVETERKKLKEESRRESLAIDGIANILKGEIIPIEQYLEKQEHFVEIKKAAEDALILEEHRKKVEQERLEQERLAQLQRVEREKEAQAERARIKAENEALQEKLLAAGKEMARQQAEKAAIQAKADESRRQAEEAASKERLRQEAEKAAIKAKAHEDRKRLHEEALKERLRHEAENEALRAKAIEAHEKLQEAALKEKARHEAESAAIMAKAKEEARLAEIERARLQADMITCPKCGHSFETNKVGE